MTIDDPAAFVRANTRLAATRLVPEIVLHQADTLLPLWRATEPELEALGVPPPYWAFAWAGGQAIARHVLDHPALVRGRTVLDFAAGSGIGAIAAALAGAARVFASEIDPLARAALRLNAAANGVDFAILDGDIIGRDEPAWQVVLAGDVCYEQPMASRVEAWLKRLARHRLVLLGDPRRSYLPKDGIVAIGHYPVATTTEIEDSDLRNATVWRVVAPEPVA
jgi:predicted nicotinamide N-methyase